MPSRNGSGDAGSVHAAVVRTSALLRAGTVVVSLVLLREEVQDAPWTAALLAGMTLANIAVASVGPRHRASGDTAHLVVDAAAFVLAAALLGGADSPILLLAMVLPVIGGLLIAPVPLVAIAAAVIGCRAAMGGPGEDVFVFLATGSTATGVGVLVARRRLALPRTMLAVDGERRTLARVDGGAGARRRAARVLHAVATVPLGRVRADLAADGAVPATSAETLREVAAELRAIVAELHAATARPSDPTEALRRAALRRAPEAHVVCRVDPAVDTVMAGSALAILPETLDLLASRDTRYLEITLVPDVRGAALSVAAGPCAAAPDDVAAGGLAGRPEVLSATVRAGHGVWTLGAAREHDARRGTDRREAARLVAVVRVGWIVTGTTIPLVVGGTDPGFVPLATLAVATLGLGALLNVLRPDSPLLWRILLPLNAVLLLASFSLAGDAEEALQPLFLTAPLIVGAIFGGRQAVATGLLLSALAPVLAQTTQPDLTIGLAWSTVVAAGVAACFHRFETRTLASARERNASLARLLETSARENRTLAAGLHDDALQHLLAARQELLAPDAPDAMGRARDGVDRALDAVEGALGDLGTALDHAPGELGRVLARLCGDDVELRLGGGVEGPLDDLVHTVVRELVRNARRHAQARTVTVDLARDGGTLRLEVRDDGVGFAPERLRAALDDGHIGLASARDRIEFAGGTFSVSSEPGQGTVVQAGLPVPR